MDAIAAIMSRLTVPQVKMGEPGPDAAQTRTILEAGAAAPDHGRLKPWRFLTVSGSARAELGALFARGARAANSEVSAEEIAKLETSPLRAPLVIVVAVRLDPAVGDKIPEIERTASAAAAAQNMLLAAHALGFAGKWSTGKPAYDPVVRDGLGLSAHDRIIGFLFIGSLAAPQAMGPRPALEEVASAWGAGTV